MRRRFHSSTDDPGHVSHCPYCLAEAGQEWPVGTYEAICRRHADRFRRVQQVQSWNADHAHQVHAGHASWAAFSARWRASSGLGPLFAKDVRRYVTPEMIHEPCGMALSPELQATIYRSWCGGQLYHVTAWLDDDAEPLPDPDGLWRGATNTLDLNESPNR